MEIVPATLMQLVIIVAFAWQKEKPETLTVTEKFDSTLTTH